MTERELLKRTKQFALRGMKLAAALPRDDVARTISRQLVRAATSVGANYRAACRGRSRAEFVAKLGNVEEEADETAYWMELMIEGQIMKPVRVAALWGEANQLMRIMARSKISARQNDKNRKLQIANRK